jgi:hypothetical protein
MGDRHELARTGHRLSPPLIQSRALFRKALHIPEKTIDEIQRQPLNLGFAYFGGLEWEDIERGAVIGPQVATAD